MGPRADVVRWVCPPQHELARKAPSSRSGAARRHASSMPRMEDAPPLYKPELIEPKKRLTILQRCYKEPWVPIG